MSVEEVFATPQTVTKMSDQDIAAELQQRGYRVKLEKKTGEGEVKIREVADKDVMRFAVASDFHLCSRFQQLTHLRAFYRYAKKRKCAFVLMPGDIVEGSHKMHRDAAFYQFVHGADAQIDYAIKNIPDVGLKTYGINGNHDYSHFNDAGVSVGQRVASERDDFEFIGDLGASVHLGPLTAYLWHPMGGASYARSYKLQKWIEQRPPEQRPDILFAGHIHINAHVPNYAGVEAFLVGCFQAQTPFINRLALTPNVGGLILDVATNSKGKIHRVQSEWVHFPDWIRDDY